LSRFPLIASIFIVFESAQARSKINAPDHFHGCTKLQQANVRKRQCFDFDQRLPVFFRVAKVARSAPTADFFERDEKDSPSTALGPSNALPAGIFVRDKYRYLAQRNSFGELL
jgi:hypothetical protein